ncbi:probable phenylalanine--tRNA ligase, mitochondrial [Limulus polyphemus]|uniref:phenylalanine--tRNA ligase n=1 Tax=Limulus polyphemus TaxID=6850 RepID=A0ABM1TP64_LIMPO|nr:probable phenylalanine--tRNA ligase, mitochondrial [Limulus polyphemus]
MNRCSCTMICTRMTGNIMTVYQVTHCMLTRTCSRYASSTCYQTTSSLCEKAITLNGTEYPRDCYTNVSDRILNLIGKNLHHKQYHPLCLLKQRIVNFIYSKFVNSRGNPIFSVHDNLNPVVTLEQNFDNLLVPHDHPSRRLSDSYYINSKFMLRAHTSAHQHDLIKCGLDNFLVFGDVYRRDEIDSTHYPVFHQMEGVRLCGVSEFTQKYLTVERCSTYWSSFETKSLTDDLQFEWKHIITDESISVDRRIFLVLLSDFEYQWTDTYFPFTHPSWELEIKHKNDWLEVLGCGIIEQRILEKAGAGHKIGWAAGLGLERLAMKLYDIPDIRLFWSTDSGFLVQFHTDNPDRQISFKPFSHYPQCINDISFWIPEEYSSNDFYDLVRSVGGDIIEQVTLVDVFTHPRTKRTSHCYRIVYRHMEKTLTQQEVNEIHTRIEEASRKKLHVEIR